MTRSLPLRETFAVYGVGMAAKPKSELCEKLPAALVVKVTSLPSLPVMVTVTPARPLQSSGSWPVGCTVPATSKPLPVAAPPPLWQVLQASPGFMSALLPPVYVTPLVQTGGPLKSPPESIRLPASLPLLPDVPEEPDVPDEPELPEEAPELPDDVPPDEPELEPELPPSTPGRSGALPPEDESTLDPHANVTADRREAPRTAGCFNGAAPVRDPGGSDRPA